MGTLGFLIKELLPVVVPLYGNGGEEGRNDHFMYEELRTGGYRKLCGPQIGVLLQSLVFLLDFLPSCPGAAI